MERKTLFKNILLIVVYFLIVGLTVWSVLDYSIGFTGHGIGLFCFQLFTVESNIFVGICSLIVVIFSLRNIIKKGDKIPLWVTLLIYTSTCAVTLTFLTVVLFLSPIIKYQGLFSGPNFYMHALTPLIALFSYCTLLRKPMFSFKFSLLGLIPTIIYGAVYVVFVFALHKWGDFYNFNFNGLWYVILPSMVIASYLIAIVIFGLRKLVNRIF